MTLNISLCLASLCDFPKRRGFSCIFIEIDYKSILTKPASDSVHILGQLSFNHFNILISHINHSVISIFYEFFTVDYINYIVEEYHE